MQMILSLSLLYQAGKGQQVSMRVAALLFQAGRSACSTHEWCGARHSCGHSVYRKKPIHTMANTRLHAPSPAHAATTLWVFPFCLESCGETTLRKSWSTFVPRCCCWTWPSSPTPGCPPSTCQRSVSPWPRSFTTSSLQLSRGCAWSLFTFTLLLSKFSTLTSQSTS